MSKFYVSTVGSDELGLGTMDKPFLTIQKAFNAADSCDVVTVEVAPGTYTSCVKFDRK